MQYRANNNSSVLISLFFVSCVLVLPHKNALASPFKLRDSIVNASDIYRVNVTIKVKQKTVTKNVACKGSIAGMTVVKKSVLHFRPLTQESKRLDSEIKKNSSNKKKSDSLKKAKQQLKALIKASANSCVPPTPVPTPTQLAPEPAPEPTTTPVPPTSTFLTGYTGEFGTAQARHLLNRFGIGASPLEVQEAVSRGLAGTVDNLLTWKDEPEIDAIKANLECDAVLSGEKNRVCNVSNVNDLDKTGYRYAWYDGAISSKNQFFYRTFLMLHDDFMSANSDAVLNCDKFALAGYKNMLWQTAKSGDFQKYLSDYMTDQMGALRYLTLGTSRAPAPNQNFARELWQLGSIGQNRPTTGELNYDELDIIAASNILAGWSIQTFKDEGGRDVCYGAKVPGLSVPGRQLVFHGTPYETLVSSPEELLEATLRHPSASENIASKIYSQFVNPDGGTPEIISEIASSLRANQFNINATLKSLMLSNGFYNPAVFNTVPKHPVQLVLGFLRQTGIPFKDYPQLDALLGDLGQRPFQPVTVFGWYPEKLTGEAYILERRNAINALVIQTDAFYAAKNFSYFDRFLRDLPTAGASPLVIDRVSNALGVPLTADQITKLEVYMNSNLTTSGCPALCGGKSTRVVADVFDPNAAASKWARQIRGVLVIIGSLPKYQIN